MHRINNIYIETTFNGHNVRGKEDTIKIIETLEALDCIKFGLVHLKQKYERLNNYLTQQD
jgi:hypothetical protein